MPEEQGLGLVEFLGDLRAELQEAQDRALATSPPGTPNALRLGVDEITVTLEVAHERTLTGEMSGKVTGRFWVFGSAEAGASAGVQRGRTGTQTLTLTLKPRVETVGPDNQGVTESRVDVDAPVGAKDHNPPAARPTR
ncbi:trypco2 family protein [Kribbella sp. NPDC051586]|uniref:trypco2 family protein n=1 Tax=Kribbella sp. NPDC051586 TaxID=3364118 RepID=UPI003795A5D3